MQKICRKEKPGQTTKQKLNKTYIHKQWSYIYIHKQMANVIYCNQFKCNAEKRERECTSGSWRV